MGYFKPDTVRSPKTHWELHNIQYSAGEGVLYDGGEGQDALAIGRWDGKPCLAIRWNGQGASPVGSPQSRGLPTWFILPEWMYDALLGNSRISLDDRIKARKFLKEP